MKRTDTNKSRAYLITDLSKSVSDWVTSRMRKRPKKWARRAKLIGWRWPLESWNVWFMNFFCLVLREHLNKISGDDSQVVPPVPIPNTVVKHLNVESTWVATPWEDRKLPVQLSTCFTGAFLLYRRAGAFWLLTGFLWVDVLFIVGRNDHFLDAIIAFLIK